MEEIIMPRKETHVVPAGEKGWAVRNSGSKRVNAYYETKKDAVAAGRRISKNQGTEFIVHGKDGRIQNPDSHGNDPCPPKDQR